jgi:hypothetical protein
MEVQPPHPYLKLKRVLDSKPFSQLDFGNCGKHSYCHMQENARDLDLRKAVPLADSFLGWRSPLLYLPEIQVLR